MKASKWLIITLFSKFPKCYPIYKWLGTPGARSQTALFSVLMPLQTGCVAKWWRIPGFALATGCNRSNTAIWPVFLGYGDGSNFRLLQIYRPTRTLLYTYNHRRYIDYYTVLKYITPYINLLEEMKNLLTAILMFTSGQQGFDSEPPYGRDSPFPSSACSAAGWLSPMA